MHGQGNYTNQAGQGHYPPPPPPPPPPFQQNPAVAAVPPPPPPPPPPHFHHGSHPAQPQVIQQGRPSFQLPPGSNLAYLYSLPGPPQQGFPWNQNIHKFPQLAPLPALRAYPLPSSQGYTMNRVQAHQTQNVPLPPPPPRSSGSYLSTPDSYRSSMMVSQHSSLHPLGPLPPPPPFPPPPPPGAPPLPPSDNLSKNDDNLSKNDESHSLKEDLSYDDNLMLEHPTPMMVAEDSRADKYEVLYQSIDKNGPEMKVLEDVFIHSPADSDMDMEDDITQPADENQKVVSKNSNDCCIPMSQEFDAENQLNVAIDGFIPFTGSPVSKDLRVGTEEVPLGCEEYSEDDDLGMTLAEKMEQPVDVNVKISLSQHQDFPKPVVPAGVAETGSEKISNPLSEGATANPFELLQGYATDNSTENEIENLLEDVSTSVFKVESTNFDTRDGCEQSLKEPRLKILLESNNLVSSKCMTNKTSLVTVEVEESTDKINGNKKSVGVEDVSFNKRDVKSNSAKSIVDEFGRMVRKGDRDSDTSDSPRHTRKHARRHRRRSRSLSSSRSPRDRRRRSPWKRKERRDRSRSLSPKRRRNRTRSPVLRRSSEHRDVRREPVPLQECFDFRRGKCYRGTTCRYSHHESGKNERSRYNRGKQQYQESPPSSRNPDLHEDSSIRPLSKSVHENKEVKDDELKLSQDIPNLEEVKDTQELLADPATHPHDKLNSRESTPVLVGDVRANNLPVYSSQNLLAGNGNYFIQESHTENPDKFSKIDSLISESSSLGQPSKAALTHLTADKPVVEQNPAGETWTVGSPTTKPHVSESVPSQLNIYFPPVSQVTSLPVAQLIFQGYNSMSPNKLFNSKPENYPSYQAPVPYQSSHFSLPSNSSSNSFLLPPPPHSHLTANETTGQQSNPHLPTHQSFLHPPSGFSSSIRPYPTDVPNQPHTGQYQGYPGVSNITSQLAAPRAIGEDRLNRYSDQGVNPLHSNGMHASFGSGNVFPHTNSSHGLPYFQQGSYGMQYSGPYGVSSQLGEAHSRLPDFSGPRISNHFNPYASTFDQPMSTQFSSNASIQENDKPFNSVYGMSSVSIDAHRIGNFSSKNMISSSSSAKPAGGNQYDPLFDSIEPASNSFNGSERKNNETLGGSDNFTRYSGIRENIKQEEGAFVSVSGFIENEEYGETADAEVGDVVNGKSPSSNPNDATDMNAGDIEIDQVKGSGKKKGKDSKSSKNFKGSIASFVKEVLKPSWRQGNMSKEAFKTIVKKTVDKVSGAMKSHPKSQAKINHYIDSSRGKLTKLVMGYVEKYAR